MSAVQSCASSTSNSSSSSKKSGKPFVPAKKAVLKDQIVSSKFKDVKQFVPSYVKTEPRPTIQSLMSMEYAKIWQEEHKLYEKNVIEEKLIKKKPLKRPTFQLKNSVISATKDAILPRRKIIQFETKEALKISSSILPKKSVWK